MLLTESKEKIIIQKIAREVSNTTFLERMNESKEKYMHFQPFWDPHIHNTSSWSLSCGFRISIKGVRKKENSGLNS